MGRPGCGQQCFTPPWWGTFPENTLSCPKDGVWLTGPPWHIMGASVKGSRVGEASLPHFQVTPPLRPGLDTGHCSVCSAHRQGHTVSPTVSAVGQGRKGQPKGTSVQNPGGYQVSCDFSKTDPARPSAPGKHGWLSPHLSWAGGLAGDKNKASWRPGPAQLPHASATWPLSPCSPNKSTTTTPPGVIWELLEHSACALTHNGH